MLFPELTRSRIPTDIAVRSGLISRSQTYTMTSNSAGNCGFVIYPQLITNATWAYQFADSTFNPDTGVQTPSATSIAAPMTGLTSVVSYRLTALSIEFQPIVSSLNN